MRLEKMKGHGGKFPSPSRKSFASRIPAITGVHRGLEKPLKTLLLDHRSGEKTKGTSPRKGHSSIVREPETKRPSGGGAGKPDLPGRMEEGSFRLGPNQRTGSGIGGGDSVPDPLLRNGDASLTARSPRDPPLVGPLLREFPLIPSPDIERGISDLREGLKSRS